MSVHHPGVLVIGDVVAAVAVAGWWAGAYETHIGTIVTTMAGIYYLFQFAKWIKNLLDKD